MEDFKGHEAGVGGRFQGVMGEIGSLKLRFGLQGAKRSNEWKQGAWI